MNELSMTEEERCKRVLDGMTRGLAAIFGEGKISVETEKQGSEFSLMVDGWICLMPTTGVPKPRTIKPRHGKEFVVNYTEEQPLWALSTLRFIPSTLWEPEDVDITEIDTLSFPDCMHLIITLIAKNIYNQWCESESERELHVDDER